MRSPAAALLAASVLCSGARAAEEQPRPWSLDLTVHGFGIGIGNSRHIDGLRLNFRDTAPFVAHGVNATVWSPSKGAADSEVDGLALGLPLTGAGRVRGLALGLGVGAGADVQGLLAAGLAAGAGGTIQGVVIAGLGGGASRIQGLAMALGAGGKEVQGVVIAPACFHLAQGGRMEGVSVSAFNRILGEQRGLAVGLVNYASRLYGVQIGLLNWADNNPAGLKILPVADAHFE